MLSTFYTAVVIALGGALGALGRWLIAQGTDYLSLPAWAALVVCNVGGSMVLGYLVGLRQAGHLSESAWSAGAVGFAGAFTTWSSLVWSAITLYTEGRWLSLGVSVLLHLFLSVLGFWLGYRVAVIGSGSVVT